MNVSDSERVSSFLEKQGLRDAEEIDAADIIIFNTCGIRQAAENRVYGLINNFRKTNTRSKVIVTGCLANRRDVQKRLKGKVDLFCEIKDFPKDMLAILSDTRRDAALCASEEYLSIIPRHANNFEALVPIMTGCNNFCSYCVVPHARGREVSRPMDVIVSEARALIANECNMITLLGQNVDSYSDGKNTFPILLKRINAIPGKFWITFVSSHPKDMDDKLIETVAKCKKVCEWIHLPIQAGDNEILRRMNRKYTQNHYFGRISKIKSAFKKYKPTIPFSLSTDIIVGFPGETKKQFLESSKVMEKAKFDMAYFGQFSPRPGTTAWKMKDNVSKEEKARREFVLNEILKKTALANNRKYVGATQEVLIEKEKGGYYFGKTRTMKNVKIRAEGILPLGSFVKVQITNCSVWNLEGILK